LQFLSATHYKNGLKIAAIKEVNNMPAKVIKLTKAEQKLIAPTIEDSKTAQFAFNQASMLMKKCHSVLWKQLGELYPDAMDKNTKFNHEIFEIIYLEEGGE
jgi:hypothetical protein